MTTTDAAVLLGCTPNHVRTLVKAKKLKARKIQTIVGHHYDVDEDSVRRYLAVPQTRGYPRGRSRKASSNTGACLI